jgi:ankyrin repeat protein
MEEFDNEGWSHIHHAAFSGYQKSISRFVRSNQEHLELLTKDGQRNTPLLLACSSGQLDAVRFLVELGANLIAFNASDFGVIEVSAYSGHLHVLEYFLDLNSPEVNVYTSLVRALDHSKGSRLQIASLSSLTELSNAERLKNVLSSGAIEGVVKILASSASEEDVVINCLLFFEKILKVDKTAHEAMRHHNSVRALVGHLSSENKQIYLLAVKILTELAVDHPATVENITNNNGIDSLVKILRKNNSENSVLLDVLKTLVLFCKVRSKTQDVFASVEMGFATLASLLRECKKRKVLAWAGRTIALLVEGNERNQNLFVNEDGIPCLVQILSKSRSQEAQMAAVLAIKAIANNGSVANQELLQRKGCVKILTKMLREGPRHDDIRQLIGEALWAIAGSDVSQRHSIAKHIGINILVEFLKTSNHSLNFIGSEALVVLAEDINSKQDEIVAASATQFMIRLIGKQNTPEPTVLSIFRTFRAICIQTGIRPHVKGQSAIMTEAGIKFLVRYFVHSRKALIQADAAYTLACIALGNQDTNSAVVDMFEFSRLTDLMSQEAKSVQLIAAHALALFAFNNTHNQKCIASSGTLTYSMFKPLLDSSEPKTQAKAAFQVVVLSRIFPDEDQANTSAAGIQMLVTLLQQNDQELQAMCSNFIAGLSHTRPGIPAAFVSIGAIQVLAELLNSQSEKVRCCSAIALGYLSVDKSGQRQLLNACRRRPPLYKILRSYAKDVKLSQEFVERWKHYQRLSCLPPM